MNLKRAPLPGATASVAAAFALLFLLASAAGAQDERSPVSGAAPPDANRGALVTPGRDGARGSDAQALRLAPGSDHQVQRIAPVPDPPHVRYLYPEVWTTSSSFPIGTTMDLYFRVNEDAFVYIFNTDTRGVTTQIFPNWYDTRNRVRAGAVYRIPDRGYSLQVQGPPGVETIHILAVSQRYAPLRVYDYYSRSNPFPENVTGPMQMLRELEDEARRSAPSGGGTYDRGGGRDPQVQRIAPVPDPPRPSAPSYIYGCATLTFRTFDPRHGSGGYPMPPMPPMPVPNLDATIRISTAPTGARVFLDGSYQGTTPLTITVAPGDYELLVQKSGYRTEVRSLQLSPRENQRISLRLSPLPGSWWWPGRNRD